MGLAARLDNASWRTYVVLGDGEASLSAILDLYKELKAGGVRRRDMIRIMARRFPWIYAPSLYDVRYNADGTVRNERVMQVLGFMGLERYEVPEAQAGDIVAFTGLEHPRISETLLMLGAFVVVAGIGGLLLVPWLLKRMSIAANEELQSTNEELQSTNEELTTSKEEMQSMNEELQTLNTELQAKVDELLRASNDMKNLLDSTDIATLFLDNDLKVRRFTTQATKIIKLIPGVQYTEDSIRGPSAGGSGQVGGGRHRGTREHPRHGRHAGRGHAPSRRWPPGCPS